MTALPTLRRRHRRPLPLGDHAVEDLRFIRQTMERASALTAIPGWGQVAIGVTALAAAGLAARAVNSTAWLGVWLAEAVLAVAIGSAAMAIKSRAAGLMFQTAAWRQFALSFSLPLAAGIVLPLRLHQAGRAHPPPGGGVVPVG